VRKAWRRIRGRSRCPLDRAIGALALAFAEGDADAGAVGHRAHRADRAGDVAAVEIGLDDDLVRAEGPFEIGQVDEDADLADAGVPLVADEQRGIAAAVVDQVVIVEPDRARDHQPVAVEGHARAQIDQAADAALDQLGRGILVDVDAGEQFGGNVLEAQRAAALTRRSCRGHSLRCAPG
jgi:hypothetical protein